jgi:hypothetical protein
VVFAAVFGLLLRHVGLHFHWVKAVNVGMPKVTGIFGTVVVLIHRIAEGLDNSLTISNNVSRRQRCPVPSIRRGKSPGSEVKGEEFGGHS